MTEMELKKLLADVKRARIAVIGDYCLDSYWFIDDSASEISVETQLPTRPVSRQRYSLGGAGNVVLNLVAIGVQKVYAFGVVGDDPFGREIVRLLQVAEADAGGILTQADAWSTHVYTKPYVGDTEQNRIDFGNFNRLSEATAERLIKGLARHLPDVDVVIINEQVASGIHNSPSFRQQLGALIAGNPGKIFLLDSRHHSAAYAGTIRKINAHEAVRLCNIQRAPNEVVMFSEARQAAETLFQRWQKPVFVSRGERGCIVHDARGFQEVHGLLILGRTDPVGAGDSMLSGIAAALAAGRDPLTGAMLGNFIAGVTVQKLYQTGTASQDEIMAIGRDPDYIYRPELAEDIRQARYVEGADIEIVTEPPRGASFTHAIFDHDGTISTLRQGWEQIMEPMMIRAILGDRFRAADEALYQKAVHRVRDFIDKTTGVQTITQMQGLVEIVREFGCVPEDQILDEAGYKRIYNAELMNLVCDRAARLKRGELAVEDYTLKNAPAFLRALHGAGLKLYLASGTDSEDVIREAEALGYAGLFEDRIYGAAGNMPQEAKKIVLEQILNDIGPAQANRLVTFGDGPVEIRATRKRGGYTVGIASDEVRRFGLNRDKRARLIRAGADLVVPDYSQMTALLSLLKVK